MNSERDNRKSIRKKKIAACFPALKSARKEEKFCQKLNVRIVFKSEKHQATNDEVCQTENHGIDLCK